MTGPSPVLGAYACLPLPELNTFYSAQDFVNRLVGGRLDTTGARLPHLTLVYYGDMRLTPFGGLAKELDEVVRRQPGPLDLDAAGFEIFPRAGKGATLAFAITLSPALKAFRTRMLNETLPWISAKQFPSWRPHVTLGTVPEDVDCNGLGVPEALRLRWSVSTVELRAKAREDEKEALVRFAMRDGTARRG